MRNKKYLSKAMASAAVVAMLASGSVMAAEKAEPVTSVFEESNGVVMVPLRSNAESLGYTVEWNEEGQRVTVSLGAQSTTFAIGKDAYAFSKAMPVSLGHAPILHNGDTTYVPLALFTDVLDVNSKTVEDGVILSLPNYVTIEEIAEDGALTVADETYGHVIVYIDENTEILANGAAVSKDEIKVGMLADIEYGPQMTRSIPPQTTAVKIELQNLETDVEEAPVVSATVTSINAEEKSLTINETDGNYGEVIVNVSDMTIIKDKDNNLVDFSAIKEGAEIQVMYDNFMTMSIPPQTNALEITVK